MNVDARDNVEVVRVGGLDAGENFVISRSGDHGGVVAGEFGVGEIELRRVGCEGG